MSTVEETGEQQVQTEVEADVAVEEIEEGAEGGEVTLEGLFVGLIDGENRHGKTFKYLLLNDGSEVLRIDLRPLIGYSDIDVIEKLTVARGEYVVVQGRMEDGEFKVSSLTGQ